jgi:thiol-disulfide isomerase/thioredoxin
MKKVIIFSGVLVLLACNRERIRITGHIANAKQAVILLDEVDVYSTRVVDSVLLKNNGNFRFAFNAKIPGFYQLRLSPDQVIVLFPKPGDRIRVEADTRSLISSLNIEGSHDSEQVTKLIRFMQETRNALDSINALYGKASSDTMRERLSREYQDILEKHRRFSIAFILTHSNSLASIYALYQQYQPGSYVFYKNTDLQFFKIVSDTLSKYFPKSKHVIALQANTKKMISDYKSQLLYGSLQNAEESLPEVAFPDLRGDTINLRSLKGKLVLLCFWASWDKNSVKQNLQLKKLYNKYKNKGFEIFQVSFDNSVNDWRNAVLYDELPWISVIDVSFPNSIVAGNYNITELPFNYLIGKDNISILARNLTPVQLHDKLQELLKQ